MFCHDFLLAKHFLALYNGWFRSKGLFDCMGEVQAHLLAFFANARFWLLKTPDVKLLALEVCCSFIARFTAFLGLCQNLWDLCLVVSFQAP